MKKILIAAVLLLVVAGGGLAVRDAWQPARSAEAPGSAFADWAVVLVSGDYRAHSGAPSGVFDNARRDLATAFAGIGFAPANMLQFSVDYDAGTRHSDTDSIAAGIAEAAAKAKAGCLIYFTSHGAPTGIVVGNALLAPADFAQMVNSACGTRPSVIVMSACYSGQFVAPLAGPNRVVITAARPDRTSFGCGEMDHYTYFDDCFLRAMKLASDFPGLGQLVQQCVAEREQIMHATPPSEPQLSVGQGVLYTLAWK